MQAWSADRKDRCMRSGNVGDDVVAGLLVVCGFSSSSAGRGGRLFGADLAILM